MKITNIEESFLYVVQLLISEAESNRLLEEKLVETQNFRLTGGGKGHMTDEELISYRDDVREFMIAENEADTRIFQDVSKELISRLARGRKAIEAMDEIRRIFDTCPSYDVNTFQDIDIILMRFENEYSGVTDEN